jgi:hypothetical protein
MTFFPIAIQSLCRTDNSADYWIFCEFIKLDKKEFTVLKKFLFQHNTEKCEVFTGGIDFAR